jgi:hypothetical protein
MTLMGWTTAGRPRLSKKHDFHPIRLLAIKLNVGLQDLAPSSTRSEVAPKNVLGHDRRGKLRAARYPGK